MRRSLVVSLVPLALAATRMAYADVVTDWNVKAIAGHAPLLESRSPGSKWKDATDTIGPDENLEVRRDVLERSLRQQVLKERRGIESGLAVLASIGTTAPFVGLFGTVWGIIHALSRISGTGSASLEVVAGPIGEALIATGIGIAVAVPAVLAYNFFVRRLKVFLADLEDFASSFVTAAVKDSYPVAARDGRNAPRSLVRREASA